MTDFEKAKYHEMARIVKAMAHPTRLFIIDTLKKQSYCVLELTEMIGADISTVSKHLSVLKNAGILRDEKRGNCVYYHLYCNCVLDFYQCIINVIKTNHSHSFDIIEE